MKKHLSILLLAVITCYSFSACTKENSNSTLRVRLTDAPTALDEVNIDLKAVHVKMDRDSATWVTLQTKPGVYNLLGLQNGVDTLIAEGELATGAVKEIRLVLGTENNVVENGRQLPLTIPSGGESGLKIKISKPLRAGLDSLVIDFDAAMSVRKEADGYRLRPVLRIK